MFIYHLGSDFEIESELTRITFPTKKETAEHYSDSIFIPELSTWRVPYDDNAAKRIRELLGEVSYQNTAIYCPMKNYDFSDLIRELKSSVSEEVEYFESPKGYKTFGYSPTNEYIRRFEETSWGKIENDYVTLFHGTTKRLVTKILLEGLKAKRIGELPKLVWFGATPYMAFYFGDIAVQVSIPASWVTEYAGGLFGEYMVERDIPVDMIVKIIKFEEWSPGDVYKRG